MAQQKLYTEEQVKEMIRKSRETGLTAEYLILTTKPIELPTDKRYTAEDIRTMFALTLENAPSTESHTRMISDREYRHFVMDTLFNRLILRLQPKTQWDVEFIDGKLKLI